LLVVSALLWGCGAACDDVQAPLADGDPAPVYGYRVVRSYPHDPNAFTQGLIFHDGFLYEGTGVRGESTLRRVELETGEVLEIRHLASEYFGEGIALWKDRLHQLTWQSNVGFIYEREGLRLIGDFTYPTEGWGLTQDGSRLIMSDGTDTLRFYDPDTFEETGRLQVRSADGPVEKLNELEYVAGEIYANVWRTDRVAIISPETGRVVGWIDLAGLTPEPASDRPIDVLNGIAYDAQGDRLFVTGKYWPALFEIELIPRE
jgi:glutamine cyclotransferase